MASVVLFRASARPTLYVCARCAFQASKQSKRWAHDRYAAKVAQAELDWQEQALEVKAGNKKSMFAILEERGLIQDTTSKRSAVENMMTQNRVGAYVGIDPTGPSLHIGHMLPLMSLFWMYVHGYQAVTLLGGATAKVGDPTGRLKSREQGQRSIQTSNMINMHFQLKKLWINVEAYGLRYGYKWNWAWKRALLNNNAWQNKLTIMEFLKILGPGARIGQMLAKDTVKNKMEKGDGMSFAEFTYPLLQAWDWWHMYNALGIRIQIGGSDQFGNITAGVEAVKYIAKTHPAPDTPHKTTDEPFGFTTPLLTNSAGVKFGKSAGNAIWLEKDMTSTFELYGYLLKTSDEDVAKYLKLFTFIPIEDIDALIKEHMENPSQRKAQHKLASEFVELVHGCDEAKFAIEQHQVMFQNSGAEVPKSSYDPVGASALALPQVTLNNRPKAHLKLPRTLVETKSIGKILYACGLADSASEGHRLAAMQSLFIGGGAAGKKEPMNHSAVNWTRVKTWKPECTKQFLIDDHLLLLRRGKANIRIIDVVDDDIYEKSMARYPGDGKRAVVVPETNEEREERLKKEEMEGVSWKPELAPAAGESKRSRKQSSSGWANINNQLDHDESLARKDFGESGFAEDDDAVTEMSPEKRVQKLNRKYEESLQKHHTKMDRKHEPKGKFMGHNSPRGPVPSRWNGGE